MNEKTRKKEIMKGIILKLHEGMAVGEAKELFEKEVGNVSSTEIAEIEQSLINDGLSPDQIKKFCNVHTLLFQSALEKATSVETSPSHPVYLFKLENKEIDRLAKSLEKILKRKKEVAVQPFKKEVRELLQKLKGVETHYERKEQLLFPFLEKQGFMGPSKVMWGKDNEIRDLLNAALAGVEKVKSAEEMGAFGEKTLGPLAEEITGMIFKEENILFPTALEKLSADDWVDILRESDDVGYVFIEKPEETDALIRHLEAALLEEPVAVEGGISFPTGTVQMRELMYLLNTLPVDVTFVGSDDRVKYFTDGRDRIFTRTRSVIGRKVQNCHPPQSVDVVEKILASFKEGKKDFYDFWLNYRGRFVYVRYFAVRDKSRDYLGTLEVTQDLTEARKLEGEKRLIDERD